MASDSLSQIVTEKLDKKNFQAWKFRMKNFLMGKGYLEFVQEMKKNQFFLMFPINSKCRHSKHGMREPGKLCTGCLSVFQTL